MQTLTTSDLKKLKNWLRSKPWGGGPDGVEDVIQEAYVIGLSRSSSSLNMYWLCREAARSLGFLPKRDKKTGQWGLTREEKEVAYDPEVLPQLQPAQGLAKGRTRLDDLDDFLAAYGSGQVKQAVELIRQGHDHSEAAFLVGWSPVQLCRALADIGLKITGRRPVKYQRKTEFLGQMELFGGVQNG